MEHPYQKLEELPMWGAVSAAVDLLVENRDLAVTTVDDLVVGFLVARAVGENPIVIDWSKLKSEEEFYDSVLRQCKAPAWHGRNLDALNDSWVTGAINGVGPPYSFWFLSGLQLNPALEDLRVSVESIATASIAENGGQIHRLESRI